MKIRKVEISDLENCHELESKCFPKEEAASLENIAIRIQAYSDGFYVLENEACTIIGHLNSGCTNKNDITDEAFKALIGHDPNGENAVIFSVAIAPDMRGNKLGHTLLRYFIKSCTLLGKKRILLLCKTHLIPYYKSIGFRYKNLSSSTHGGAQWHEMEYLL